MTLLFSGLTDAQKLTVQNVLAETHSYRVRAQLETLDGSEVTDYLNPPGSEPPWLEDGQVDITYSTGAGTRQATATIYDPNNDLSIRARDMWAQRRLALDYEINVPAFGTYVRCPVGRLPLTGKNPQGPYVDVTAGNLEILAQGNMLQHHDYGMLQKVTTTIKYNLHDLSGFRYDQLSGIPSLSATLPDLYQSKVTDNHWDLSLGLADSVNRDLFWTADGTCVLRLPPISPIIEFAPGQGGLLTDEPNVAAAGDGLANVVMALDSNGTELARSYAPKLHPLSGESIGQNGVPRFLVLQITLDQWQDTSVAKVITDDKLNQVLQQSLDVDFSAVPIPWLEPNDCISVKINSGYTVVTNIDQVSLPLQPGKSMTVGRKSVLSKRGRVRTRRQHQGRGYGD